MAGIKDYSTTAGNNTSVGGVSIAEGMLPSNINNAFRAIAADVREWYNDSQWVIYGDGDGSFTAAYASGTSFTIAGANVTSFYHAGRRIKAVGSSTGTIVGTISSSTFSTNTTINVTWDSGSLQSESLTIYVGILSKTNDAIPEDVIDAANLKSNSVSTAKIAADAVTGAKIADDAINSEHYTDGSIDTAHIADSQITTAKINNSSVTADKLAGTLDISAKTVTLPDASVGATKLAANAVITSKITDANVTTAKIADSNITTAKIADDAITAAKIADAVLVTASEHASHTPDEVTVLTTAGSDARYFRQDSSETISSGDTWSSGDTKIATTGAINARIVDLIDDVGGFVPIDNETSFPATNPGAGVLVSIQAISSTRTPSSGTVTIANGQGSNTVTINNVGTTVLTAGFGAIVEATSTLNTYDFHRLQPKATEVSTVATNITNVNTVATNISNVNSVASNASNINTVGSNITNVNNFANRYRIASSAPTSSLDVGDLYFDTTANELKVYKSSGWAAAGSSVNGTSQRYKYVATNNQTTFSGSDADGNTLTYDSGFIDVYLNGVHLDPTDFTATSGSSVVLASGAATGDILYIVAFGTFNVAAINADNITAGTVDNARLPSVISDKTIQATALTAKGDGSSTDGKITLNCSQNSHGVAIQAPAHSAGQSYTLILPTSVGTNGQVLATAGSSTNQLSWVNQTTGETKPTVANTSQTIAPATATTINIGGTNFSGIPRVEFIKTDGAVTTANSVSLTNATTLSVNVTLALGSYYVRVELDDGNAARSTNAIITASTAPTFSTGAGSLGTIAGNFSGTVATVAGSSDSSITFSEVTNVLTNASQANCSLASNGVITTSDFGGSSTTATTYTFTLRITDAEGQTVDREFSLTSSFGATGGGQFN